MIWGIRHSLYDLRDERLLTRAVIRIGALMSGSAKAIVYNAELSRDQHSAIGYRGAASEVIPNGFDVQRFRRDPAARDDIRSRLTLSPDAIVVCCVARFHPLKNHDGLMAAFAHAYSSDPRLRLLVVGSGMDAENPAVSEMAHRHGIQSAVVFAGETTDVARWLSAADCFCLASSSEAFPNALGEAMACELPCVATDVGEVAAVLGDCGWVVPRKDAAALGRALLQMASLPAGERATLGRQARQRVTQHYSLEQIGRRYLDLYGRVWAGARDG
jgi:glycosyltransferase involved in cell wall biosynthesis